MTRFIGAIIAITPDVWPAATATATGLPHFICQTSVDYTSTLYYFSLSQRSTETVIQHHNRERVLFKLFFGHEQHALRENSFQDLGTHALQMTH